MGASPLSPSLFSAPGSKHSVWADSSIDEDSSYARGRHRRLMSKHGYAASPSPSPTRSISVALPYPVAAKRYDHCYDYLDILERSCYLGDIGHVLELLKADQTLIHERGHLGSPLIAAAAYGDEGLVLILLDAGVDRDCLSPEYGTALHVAVKRADIDMVKLLLDHGASIDIQESKSRSTALRTAVDNGCASIVKLLCERGASVEAACPKRKPRLLSLAILRSDITMVQTLLEVGADMDHRDSREEALFLAIQKDKVESVKLLLDHGLSVDYANAGWGSILEAASAFNAQRTARMLIDQGAHVDATGGKNDATPLVAAAACGYQDLVVLLLDKGARIDGDGDNQGRALHAAAWHGHAGIVRLLLDKGANINATSGKRRSPLAAAITVGHVQVVRIILDWNPNIFHEQEGQLHLLRAILHERAEILQLMLENKVNISECDERMGNALHLACRGRSHEYHDMAKLLIRYGADVNSVGGYYGTPLQTAVACNGGWLTVEHLLKYGAEANRKGPGWLRTALQGASATGQSRRVIEELVKNGAELETTIGSYRTALQAASHNGHKETVEALLDCGANPNSNGWNGEPPPLLYIQLNFQTGVLDFEYQHLRERDWRIRTRMVESVRQDHENALQAASGSGHEKIVRILLDRDADPNLVGGLYGSALQAASTMGHVGVGQILLEHGARMDAVGGYFGDALQAAAARGHEDMVRFLLQTTANSSRREKSIKGALEWVKKRLAILNENSSEVDDKIFSPWDIQEIGGREHLGSEERREACNNIIAALDDALRGNGSYEE